MSPTFILTIEKLNSRGEGLARHDGKVYFVPWSVPGDKVLVQVEREHRDYAEARILEIIEKSPDRVDPPCPYFFKCGGCQLQQMSYGSQLKWKREIIVDALKRIARLPEVIVYEPLPSPKIWNYRNRIQLQRDQEGKIGFFKSKSHEIVEIEKCLIADERLNEKLVAGRSSLVNGEIPLELRTDDSTGFTQINIEQNEKLIELVLEYSAIKPDDRVIDLYCGNGNFTFPLAVKAKQVWGIEKESTSLALAQRQGEKEGVKNISWIRGSAAGALGALKKNNVGCDTMLVNPPRRGLEGVLEWILPFSPRSLIYVSCNSATFARDAAQLIKAGYTLLQVQPVDMFPHASHGELVGEFRIT